jgi:hypothetical protein
MRIALVVETVRLWRPKPRYPGVIGVRIGIGGHVEVVGQNRRWVQEQAESFVRQVARYGFAGPLPALFERGDEPGPRTADQSARGRRSRAPSSGMERTRKCSKPGRFVR